jgi:hypothetical protein
MKSATHDALDNDQKTFHAQLLVAVQEINEADNLLANNRGNEAVAHSATALLLSAIARTQVLEVAEKYNMVTRLTQFTKQPK